MALLVLPMVLKLQCRLKGGCSLFLHFAMTILPFFLPQENGGDRERGHRDWAKLHIQKLDGTHTRELDGTLLLQPSSSPHLLALAGRLLAADAPISSCPWHCQDAFSSSSLLLLPESCLWNGRQPRHYPQGPHLDCPTGFLLKGPTSGLLAAPVSGLGNCMTVGFVQGGHHPSNTACSDAGWNF